jgi:Uncharacterized protein conserved in bacteria
MNNKDIILNVDYFDTCGFVKDELYDEKYIDNLCKNAAELGVNILNWRISVVGKAFYNSKVEYIIDDSLDNEHSKRVKSIMSSFDPLELAVKCARKYGLKIFVWVTMYDDYYPKLTSRLFLEHPEWQWVDRSGDIYYQGVFNYCYEELRKFKMEMVKEIADYCSDGIFFCMRSHAPHVDNPYDTDDMFGFNKPIVDEYKRRYSIDMMEYDDASFSKTEGKVLVPEFTGGPKSQTLYKYDDETWARLKGEYHTLFLKEASEYLKSKNQSMIVMVTGDYSGVYALGRTNKRTAQFHSNYHKWVEEGYVEGLAIIPTYQWQPELYKKACPTVEQELEQLRRYKTDLGNSTMIYLWYDVAYKHGYKWKDIRMFADKYLKNEKSDLLDGIILHEEMIFEFSA